MNESTYIPMKDMLNAYFYCASRIVVGTILTAYTLGGISEGAWTPSQIRDAHERIKTEQNIMMKEWNAKHNLEIKPGELEEIAK